MLIFFASFYYAVYCYITNSPNLERSVMFAAVLFVVVLLPHPGDKWEFY
jgi:hypothetical protein